MKDKNNIKIFFYIFIFITFASQILAQENKDNESKSPSEARPPVKGLPFEIDEKKRISEADASKKKEGWFPTGIGGPFSDANNGAGFGGRVFLFNNGKRTDPFFEYTPYRHRFFLNLSNTTRNAQYHWLDWDAPYIIHVMILRSHTLQMEIFLTNKRRRNLEDPRIQVSRCMSMVVLITLPYLRLIPSQD